MDLDDLTGTTAGGIHLATMGGLWQALVWGFLGILADSGRLQIDPHLPAEWNSVSANLRFDGNAVHVRAGDSTIEIDSSGPIDLAVGPTRTPHHSRGDITFVRRDGTWRTSP